MRFPWEAIQDGQTRVTAGHGHEVDDFGRVGELHHVTHSQGGDTVLRTGFMEAACNVEDSLRAVVSSRSFHGLSCGRRDRPGYVATVSFLETTGHGVRAEPLPSVVFQQSGVGEAAGGERSDVDVIAGATRCHLHDPLVDAQEVVSHVGRFLLGVEMPCEVPTAEEHAPSTEQCPHESCSKELQREVLQRLESLQLGRPLLAAGALNGSRQPLRRRRRRRRLGGGL
mmetsp:Transcript_40811/g.87635  ORF Transcript_40811/g.87635 Transcript_40811/m.87635 type:complete len:226 (-) Transcript_40811:535-1212(-)